MPPLPPDTRAAGQPGHIADHDQISDYLAALEAQVLVLQSQMAGAILPSSVQSGSYVLASTDLGTVVEVNSAIAATVTIPPSSSSPFPVGAVIFVAATGIGVVTIVAGSGVIMASAGNHVNISAQYAEVKLRQRSLNNWMLTGSLA
jgi:hypothetical protein